MSVVMVLYYGDMSKMKVFYKIHFLALDKREICTQNEVVTINL